MQIQCSFVPQIWSGDTAVTVEAPGPSVWEVSREDFQRLTGHSHPDTIDYDPYALDELRNADAAPGWVKEWLGPFEVEVKIPEPEDAPDEPGM
jgi:hypothetical protein